MLTPKYYSHKLGEEVLQRKKLLEEIQEIVESLSDLNHAKIKGVFESRGWKPDVKIFPTRPYDCDVYKDNVVVEIENAEKYRTTDYFHRVFFSFLAWRFQGKLDIGVLITTLAKTEHFPNGAFDSVVKDLQTFNRVLDFPIYVIGLGIRKVQKGLNQ